MRLVDYERKFTAERHDSGTFFVGMEGQQCGSFWPASRLLDKDQARQLRDELTAFLGDDDRHFLCDNTNLCANARWYKTQTERLKGCLKESERQYQDKVAEIHGLTDANEALRRDNADLTTQNQWLRQANFRRQISTAPMEVYGDLKRKHADLEAENEKLRQRVASLEKDMHDRAPFPWRDANAALHKENTELRAENARLKVDLMNARAGTTTITIGDWWRITGS